MSASPLLNLALVVGCTEAEGPGRRMAIWVQGCPLRCRGCCNPEFLADVPRQQRRAADVVDDLHRFHAAHQLEGISLLGGEPTRQAAGLAFVAEAAHVLGLSVMVYSGFTLQQLRDDANTDVARLLAATDLLVDGPYDDTKRTTNRRFIGSANQTLHVLSDRVVRDDPRLLQANTVELRIVLDAAGHQRFELNGWPVLGHRTR